MSEEAQASREEAAVAKAAEYRAKFEDSATDGDVVDPISRDGTDPEATPEVPPKPEGVPDKFYDAATGEIDYASWGKAHHELESKFHSKGDDKAETAEEGEEAGATDAPVGLFESEPVKNAREYFQENQELTDDHYSELESMGLDRDTVDAYIEGQKVRAAVPFAAAYEAAGGEEGYEEMAEWMRENLDEDSIEAYNVQMRTNDPRIIKAAVKQMAAQYKAQANIEGSPVGGGAGVGEGIFKDKSEMAAAINALDERGKRRYDNDARYREQVIRKIGASRRAGTLS